MIGTFASLAVLPETALAQQGNNVTVVNPATRPVPTTVLNPSTAPVPTTVLNPATQPALTRSVDDPGRIAYQQLQNFTCNGLAFCAAFFSPAPQGHRLVIQHVSFFVAASSDVTFAQATLNFGTPARGQSNFIVGGFFTNVAAAQPVLGYVDGPDLAYLWIQMSGNMGTSFSGSGTASIMGYVLDCSATPCNPIAGQ
jgi:hypothetical protein